MGKTLRIVTHNLNGRTVGQIVEMTALDGAATLQEAIDMGFVQGKKELLSRRHRRQLLPGMSDAHPRGHPGAPEVHGRSPGSSEMQ